MLRGEGGILAERAEVACWRKAMQVGPVLPLSSPRANCSRHGCGPATLPAYSRFVACVSLSRVHTARCGGGILVPATV